MITDELSADRLSQLGLFNPQTVTALLDEHFARRHNWSGVLWELLCFMTWHRLVVAGYPSPAERLSVR